MHRAGWQAVFFALSAVLVQIQPAQALTKTEVSKVAQGVTVMIQNAQNPQDLCLESLLSERVKPQHFFIS